MKDEMFNIHYEQKQQQQNDEVRGKTVWNKSNLPQSFLVIIFLLKFLLVDIWSYLQQAYAIEVETNGHNPKDYAPNRPTIQYSNYCISIHVCEYFTSYTIYNYIYIYTATLRTIHRL